MCQKMLQGFVNVRENLVYIYKQGWKPIHKKYKACQSKCKHKKGKPKQSKQNEEVLGKANN